ncbi:DUF885 domain-containing protein [Sphingomonas sp.]|uniref:DUF885 domain-containing protein n=1 Tax=Sphingomonas sp. TaxID=28214 RepID=UPI003B004E58
MNSFPDIDRRALLAGVAGSALVSALPSVLRAAPPPARDPLLGRAADALLRLRPDDATGNGLDVGAEAGLRARLPDVSESGLAQSATLARSLKAELARPGGDASIHREALAYACDRSIEGAAFGYGGGAPDGFRGGATPYVVTQQNGAITYYPEFLNSQHPIASKADADAYLSRVSAIGRVLDQESVRISADAAKGVAPPAFVATNALGILREFRAKQASQQGIVEALVRKAGQAGVAGDWASRCTAIVERDIYPALDRQIAALAATARASSAAGVQRLPEGEAYYRWALRLGTTTEQSPQEVHSIGLAQNAELLAKMDAILKAQGMTQGSVGQRTVALNKDPRFVFPDTDQGRADLLAYINGRIAAIRPLLPRISHLPLKAPVSAKRVPPDIQDGAALGYMNFASRDGKRPAIYYVNLKSTELWPRYQLSTLTAHEGVPGHTWQGAYIAETPGVPVIVSLLGFNAFVEGWALYAEQLVDELGLYADDPFGRLGYFQAQQFRACRLVADTGLHAMGWSREQSVRFLVEQTGKGEAAMTSETDRYCVAPGQACGYKTGHNEILRLRARAQAALGPKFDLAGFDDALVETGGVPLSLLPGVVDRWVASRSA